MEFEIDLRQYVLVMIRYWPWLLLGPIMAVLLVLVASALLPDVYETQSAVAVVRSRTDVSFDPRIRTVSDEEFEVLNRDMENRLAALVAIVKAPDIAEVVLAEVGPLLEAERRNVPDLLDMIEATSVGDVIYIRTAHKNPETAQRIANLWAEIYERHVNRIYSGRGGSNLTVISTQLSAAESEYKSAQVALESFLADNEIATLEREIATRQQTLASYQQARSVVLSRPIDMQVQTQEEALANRYADLARIDTWLAQAQALLNQVQSGSRTGAADLNNLIALVMLQSGIYSSENALELQLDGGSIGELADVGRQDVEALISVLEQRRADTVERIGGLQSELVGADFAELDLDASHPINQRLDTLDGEIMQLQAQKEAQEAELRQLEQVREQAWETYQTLRRKLTEEEIAANTTGTEVRVVSSAILPDEPSGGLLPVLVAAAAFGLLLSLLAIFTFAWWRQGLGDEATSVVSPAVGQ